MVQYIYISESSINLTIEYLFQFTSFCLCFFSPNFHQQSSFVDISENEEIWCPTNINEIIISDLTQVISDYEFKTLSENRPMKTVYNLDTVFLLVVCGVPVKNTSSEIVDR